MNTPHFRFHYARRRIHEFVPQKYKFSKLCWACACGKTIIDRCVRLAYRDYLTNPEPSRMPMLEDLYNLLRNQAEPEAQHLATALEIYRH